MLEQPESLVFSFFLFRIPKEDVDEVVHFEHTEREVCTVIVIVVKPIKL